MFSSLLSAVNPIDYQLEDEAGFMMATMETLIDLEVNNFYTPINNVLNVDVIALMSPEDKIIQIPQIRIYPKYDGSIDLSELVNNLKKLGYRVENKCISYYNPQKDMYIYCGKYPLTENTSIPARELTVLSGRVQVQIRFREDFSSCNMSFELQCESQDNEIIATDKLESVENPADAEYNAIIKSISEEDIPDNMTQYDDTKISPLMSISEVPMASRKKIRERKIGDVMEKVLEWRQLYAGYRDPQTGKTIKMSLEAAAAHVGISKKSLDDYLLQIRYGKLYGFNFIKHYHDRVGVLRAFVKKSKMTNTVKSEEEVDNSTLPFELSQLIEKRDGKTKQKYDSDEFYIGLSKKSKKI